VKKTKNHIPVLLNQVIKYLVHNPDGIYVDGTLGGAGHSVEILRHLSPNGRLIGIDWDDDALKVASSRLSEFGERAKVVRGNYADIPEILKDLKIEAVDGVLLDLGMSSFQIESPKRGFSYLLSGPLDMRMSSLLQKTAAEIVNNESLENLIRIFKIYGEERRSRKIASAIVEARKKQPIERTDTLAKIIAQVVPVTERIKTQSRIFQAIRIATNLELDNLNKFLNHALEIIRPQGRLAIIAFHSLEDRMVKNFMKKQANPCECPPELPMCVCGKKPRLKILTRKAIKPSASEIEMNPRSRSARLRAAEIL
jgi:16S rRNA (cytosine1402-N4)-methyltransferase